MYRIVQWQMWLEMQTKQHFITNLISCLQIWVPRPSWPDPTRPAHPSKFSDTTFGSRQGSCNSGLDSCLPCIFVDCIFYHMRAVNTTTMTAIWLCMCSWWSHCVVSWRNAGMLSHLHDWQCCEWKSRSVNCQKTLLLQCRMRNSSSTNNGSWRHVLLTVVV